MAVELASAYVTLIPSATGITAGIEREMGAPLTSAASKAGKNAGGKFSTGFAPGAGKVKNLLLGAFGAASVIAVIHGVTDATGSLQSSQAGLQQALGATHSKLSDIAGELAVVQKAAQKNGFSNAQVNDSLATLTRASGSSQKALSQLGLVEDISRARKVDLATATSLLAKVDTGHVALLGRYGIATKDASGKTLTMGEAVDALTKKFGGAAAANAATFTGKVQALKAQMTNVEAEIGVKLIPILTSLAGGLVAIIHWFNQGSLAAKAVEIVVGTLTAAFLAYKIVTGLIAVAQGIATLATWAWNAALVATDIALAVLTSPITLVIAAIALLALGVIYAYNHFKIFHDAVDVAWQILQNVFHWLQSNWPLVLTLLTGPIGLAVVFIHNHFATIAQWFRDLVSHITSALSGVANAIEGPFRTAFDFITRAWNDSVGKIFSLLFGSGSGKAPSIVSPNKSHPVAGGPGGGGFATGGMVPGPTGAARLAVVHAGEGIFTPGQLAALNMNQNTGGGPLAVTHVHGNVYGDSHLRKIFDEHDQRLSMQLATG